MENDKIYLCRVQRQKARPASLSLYLSEPLKWISVLILFVSCIPAFSKHSTHQVNDASSCQPDRDEDGDQLREANAGRRLQDVEILQDVRHSHEPERSEETQALGREKEL